MNNQAIKNANRSSVLYLLNNHKALSRKEIAQKLNLTPAAVTKITQSLIDDNLIIEGESVDAGKSGRREILLKLNTEDKFVFGINAERDNITFSYSSIDNNLKAIKRISFVDSFDEVIEQGKTFLLENSIDISSVFGVGICVIGSLEDEDYSVWKDKDIKQKAEVAFSAPVVVENNVKAFALGEMLYGDLSSTDSVLFLKWGPGIGSSIIANGKVFSGNDNGVAEIGHYIVDVGGEKCRCGRFGCLETVASTDAINREIKKELSIDELVDSKDENIINLLDHKIDLVALALANTATILDADNIILFGKMFKNKSIAEKLQKQCIRYNHNITFDNIRVSSLNDVSDYAGTTAIAAKHFYFEREV